ncbi:MAG: aldo/keto reductase, partial [Caldimonas sp.]
LAATVAGFEQLIEQGQIRHWGASNFDVDDMDELMSVPGGSACATNQVYYALSERGPQFALLPWQQRHSMPLMAYSPIDQGRLAGNRALQAVADRHGATPARVALAWLLGQTGVMAIPKAVREEHLRDNFAASSLQLDDDDRRALDQAFPPPDEKTPLSMI